MYPQSSGEQNTEQVKGGVCICSFQHEPNADFSMAARLKIYQWLLCVLSANLQ